MKKLWGITIVVAMFFCASTAMAETVTDIYNKANRLYADGDFAGALALYDTINVANPDLEYNKGCAYFKTGKIGPAVVHLSRALRYRPNDEDAMSNLEYVNGVKQDRERMDKPPAIISGLAVVINTLSLTVMSWIGITFYLTASLAGLGLTVSVDETNKKRFKTALIALSVVTVIWGTATGYRVYEFERNDRAVAVAPVVDAYSAPSEASDRVFTFHEGTVVTINRVAGDYALVTLSSGLNGWTLLSRLERI